MADKPNFTNHTGDDYEIYTEDKQDKSIKNMWKEKVCIECGTKVEVESENRPNEYRCPKCYAHYWAADFWIDEENT
jgi:tRNA(Ile2) C34 agmatinyltransferase TiaS